MTTTTFDKAYCRTAFGAVHYWSTGAGSNLLLLHQATQSSAEFRAIAPHLTESFRVLAVDYPGHGQSDDPDHELDVAEYRAAVIAVLDDLGIERAHLCGHHSGALLAVALAVSTPARFERLVLSGLGVRHEELMSEVLDKPMSRNLPIDADGEFLVRTWQIYRRMCAPGTPADTVFRPFRASLDARTRPYDAHDAFLRWDRDAALAGLRQPTLLLHGEHDRFADRPEALLDLIPNSRLVRIPAGGAFLFYEQPAACAAAIRDFLLAGR